MKIFYFNLVDQDSTDIYPSTENTSFPASNLKHPFTTKVFRSTSGTASVVFDFKTSEPVNSVIMQPSFNNGFNCSSFTIEANGTNEWSSPAFTTTVDIIGDYDFALKEFADQSYRFWRVSGVGSTYLEIADIFIGSSFQPAKDLSNSFSYEFRDNSNSQYNRYRQKYLDTINDSTYMDFSIKLLEKAELEDLEIFNNYCGKTRPFYLIVDPTECISTDYRKLSGKFYLEKRPIVNHIIRGISSVNYSVEVCL